VQIGAQDVPRIEVYNKIDLIPHAAPRVEYDAQGEPVRVWLSAVSGAGIGSLLEALTGRFRSDVVSGQLSLGPADGRLRALLFEQGSIVRENHAKDGGWELEVELKRRDYQRLLKHEPQLGEHWRDSHQPKRKTG
jgi:GTP-binding protein HflX